MFVIAFVVNLVRALLGVRPVPDAAATIAEPTAGRMIVGWLAFAIGSGCAVAITRRRIATWSRKNLATGLVVGAFYAGACLLTFGGALRWGAGAAVLVVGVWAGVAYAITSALGELARERR